ncbi:Uncharacterized protein HZ326_27971 [Fusarium oxysporum f. sp. albedinis]|nr:Uncharacterized protein HZ326_27971 [Fusarium oxysporum f. sp. albedinis]
MVFCLSRSMVPTMPETLKKRGRPRKYNTPEESEARRCRQTRSETASKVINSCSRRRPRAPGQCEYLRWLMQRC